MSFEGREVAYAVLHGPIYTPQAGHLKNVLRNVNDPASRAVKMVIKGDFLEVTATNPETRKLATVLVPLLTGVTHLVLAD